MTLLVVPLMLRLPRTEQLDLGDRVVCGVYFTCIAIGLGVGLSNAYYLVDGLTLLVLVPAFYQVGRRAAAAGVLRVALATFVALVAIAAAMAVAETSRHAYLVQADSFFASPDRNGQFRARAFFPQSLVLALCCCVSALLALRTDVIRNRALGIVLAMLSAAGVWASASRAALFVVAAVAVGWTVVRALQQARGGRLIFTLASAASVVVAMAFLGGFLTQRGTLVTSSDPNVASAQFRAELYRNSLAIVASNETGTGVGSVPPGEVLFASSFGTLDAARTVDSEFVLATVKFGIAGVCFWLVFVCRQWQLMNRRLLVDDLAPLVFLAFAIFLAIHVWLSLAALLALFVGVQSASRARGPGADKLRSPQGSGHGTHLTGAPRGGHHDRYYEA